MEIYLGYFVCLFKCLLALPILSGDEIVKLILKCCLETLLSHALYGFSLSDSTDGLSLSLPSRLSGAGEQRGPGPFSYWFPHQKCGAKGGFSSVVEHFLSMHEALSPSTAKIQNPGCLTQRQHS